MLEGTLKATGVSKEASPSLQEVGGPYSREALRYTEGLLTVSV
jgi:hypothetical protein